MKRDDLVAAIPTDLMHGPLIDGSKVWREVCRPSWVQSVATSYMTCYAGCLMLKACMARLSGAARLTASQAYLIVVEFVWLDSPVSPALSGPPPLGTPPFYTPRLFCRP